MKGAWEADRDPLAALRAGAPELFTAFVRAETPTLVGFFRRLGADRGSAEDLTQEVLVKLFQCADTYERQGAFASFALRVARNAWVDRRRRTSARPERESLGAASLFDRDQRGTRAGTRDDASTQSTEREEAERLRAAIADLPGTHAVVFELAVVQELPYADIAVMLDIPVGTVKSRVFHAVRKLRAALDDEADSDAEEGVA